MFYLADKTEDLSPGHRISDSSEGLLQRGKGGARIYRSFYNKDQVLEHQKITVKENKISQVKDFSAFLCVGRYKSLGSLISFL